MYKWTILLLVLSSCSAKWHEAKFYQKGGKFECEPRIISTIDTLIMDNGDTVFNTVYKTVYEPKVEYRTRWQVRFDNKRFSDSMDVMKSMYRDSLKHAFKNAKSLNKKDAKVSKYTEKTNRTQIRKENKNHWWYWFILGMPFGLVIYTVLKISIKKIRA